MLKFYKKSLVFATAIFLQIFFFPSTSCSLNYEEDSSQISNAPEFVFKNAKFSRYESSKISLKVEADILEQYKDNNAAYAQNARFFSWGKDGNLETEGKCFLLSMNSKDEIYTLFKDILIQNYSQNLEIQAQNLKWNGKTEQLTSSKDEKVFLKKDNIELQGKAFSASGVSQSFYFAGEVNGLLTTQQEKAQENESDQNQQKNPLQE